jgi:uncharacterized protein YdhG (YjbR/CyaY superfamily)
MKATEKKAGKKSKTVEEYLSTLPENAKGLLLTVRDLIKNAAPKAEELISYGIPAFKLNGRNLIYFAGWKEHISIYPIPAGDAAFQKEISSYQGGKGTLKFPINKPLPISLIKKIIKFSIKENLERAQNKNKKLELKKTAKKKESK